MAYNLYDQEDDDGKKKKVVYIDRAVLTAGGKLSEAVKIAVPETSGPKMADFKKWDYASPPPAVNSHLPRATANPHFYQTRGVVPGSGTGRTVGGVPTLTPPKVGEVPSMPGSVLPTATQGRVSYWESQNSVYDQMRAGSYARGESLPVAAVRQESAAMTATPAELLALNRPLTAAERQYGNNLLRTYQRQNLQDALSGWSKTPGELTPEELRARMDMGALQTRISPLSALGLGMYGAVGGEAARGKQAQIIGQALEEQPDNAILQETAEAMRRDPYRDAAAEQPAAYAAGATGMELAKLFTANEAASGLTGLLPWGAGPLAQAGKGVLDSALSFGSVGGVNSALAGNNAEAVARDAGIGAVGGAAGSAAAQGIGALGLRGLHALGLQNAVLPEILRQGVSGAGFAAANTGSKYFLLPEASRPTREQIAQDAAIGFLFSTVTGTVNTMKTTAANRAALDDAVNRMRQEYTNYSKALASGAGEAEQAKILDSIIRYNENINTVISQGRFVGQQAYLDRIRESVNGMNGVLEQMKGGILTQPALSGTAPPPAGSAPRPIQIMSESTASLKEPNTKSIPLAERKANSTELVEKLRASIAQMQNIPPLSSITGEEFGKGEKKITEQVGDFFKSFGNQVFRNGFGDVILDTRGIKSSIAHGIGRRKAAAFAAVPDVIQKGRMIDFQPDWKGRGQDTYVFAGPISVGTAQPTKNYVAVVVTKLTDNRYYLHEVLDENGNLIFSTKKGTGDIIKTDLLPQNDSIGESPVPIDNSIPNSAQNSNPVFQNQLQKDSTEPFKTGRGRSSYDPGGSMPSSIESLQQEGRAVNPSNTNSQGGMSRLIQGDSEKSRTAPPPPDSVLPGGTVPLPGDAEVPPLLGNRTPGDSRAVGISDADAPPEWTEHRVNMQEENPMDIDSIKAMITDPEAPVVDLASRDTEVALQLTGQGVADTKDPARNFDAAAKKDPKVRTWIQDEIETPWLEAKDRYSKNVQTQLNDYKRRMDALGIKAGTKESAAVQWYGEGVRVDQYGDAHEYTLDLLKREFPEQWENIIKADSINRQIYDGYIDRLNASLSACYPDAPARAREQSDRTLDAIHYTEERVRELKKELGGTLERLEQAKLLDEISRLEGKIRMDSGRFNQLQDDIRSGDYLRNKRLKPRKDYYHHFQELLQGFGGLKNILSTPADIDPKLAGVSDFTEPKSKWAGFMQQRHGGSYQADAVGGMVKYIPAAEYKVQIDPVIAKNRGTIKFIAEATQDSRNANRFLEWMTDWTNDLAGKTNSYDRPFQKLVGRKTMAAVGWLNGRVKSNVILGNLNSAVAQFFNIPNAVGYIKDPRYLARGAEDFTRLVSGNSDIKKLIGQSGFLRERYLDRSISQFDEGILKTPRKFAEWMQNFGDEQASRYIWLAAHAKGNAQGVDDPARYADDITRRSVAGRGIGEVPLLQKSKMVQLLTPFQVEVNNSYQVLKEMIGKKDALGVLAIFLTTWLMNQIISKPTRGDSVGYDPIGTNIDLYNELKEDTETTFGDKARIVAGRNAGELLSNLPGGSYLANMVPEQYRKGIFGENDPSRFGVGNIGINTISEPFLQALAGQKPDWLGAAANVAFPWGGKQLERSVKAAQDLALVPRITDSFDEGAEDMPASYSAGGGFRFAPDAGNPLNVARGLLFGSFATDEGKAYLDEGGKPFTEQKTGLLKTAYNAGITAAQFLEIDKALKNLDGADEKREFLMSAPISEEARVLLDRGLVGELKNPRDYSSKTAFILSGLTETQQKGYRNYSHGLLSAEQYAQVIEKTKGMGKNEVKLLAIQKMGFSGEQAERILKMMNNKE